MLIFYANGKNIHDDFFKSFMECTVHLGQPQLAQLDKRHSSGHELIYMAL